MALALAGAGCVTPPSDGGGSSSSSGTGGSSSAGSGGTPAATGGSGGAGGGGGGGTGGSGGSGTGGSATGGSGGSGTGGSGGSGSGGAPGQPDAPISSPDTGGGDTPASPSGCSAVFCDDFEGFTAGGPPGGNWKASLDRGMLAVDETKAFSGARSVRFTHNGAPAVAFIELRQPVLPRPNHVMYGRMMYYLTKTPTGQYSHFELVRGGGPLPGGGRAQLNTGGENGKVVINYEPGDCTKYSKSTLPEKKWTCYQWQFDGPKNGITISIDGTAVTDIPVAPAGSCWKAPMVMDTVHIGWESYHGNQPVELWIDDVAVGDQPIPCPAGPPSKP